MRHIIHLLFVLILGCSPEHRDGGTEPRPRLGSAPSAIPSWLAFDTQQRPIRFDPITGAVLDTGPALPGVEKALAHDPWTGRVAVFSSPEGDGGAVHWLSPSLAPDEPSFSIDGRVELLFGPDGLWLFEESYGERWRRIRRDAQWEASWGLPPPSSMWTSGGGSFGTLVSLDGHAAWLQVEPTSPAIPQVALPFPGIVPTEGAVRAAPMDDDLAIAWTVAGGILVCVVDGFGGVVHERVVTLAGEVRQAARLDTPQGPWLALALLDADDPDATSTVVALDPYGETITPTYILAGGLDEDHRVDRRMVADGARLFVATTTGVEALEITLNPPSLGPDPTFVGHHIRGPLEHRSSMFLQSVGESAL